jgi:hypothetical protein
MKRRSAILLAGVLVFSASAEDYSGCFVPGEVARYKVSWMKLPLAWSETSIDTVTENGRDLIRIRMVSKSYKAYAHIYKVDNLTEVIVDPKTALPHRIDVKINEGTIHKSHLTVFHHDKKFATFQDRISKDIKVVPINSDTQEILSFLYSSRRKDLQRLASQTHTLFVDGKLYALDLNIRKEGKIRVPNLGRVPSIEIEPIAEFDGIFLRKGKIIFWVSKQNRRMVTCIKAKVSVGKVTVKLQKVSGPGDDFWTKKK